MNSNSLNQSFRILLVTCAVVASTPPTRAQTGTTDPSNSLPVVNIIANDPEGSEIPLVPPGMEMPQRFDPAVFTVWRSGPTNHPMDVLYRLSGTASNGVDYEHLPGVVTIPAGARAAMIMVAPIDDPLVEGPETVEITLLPIACIAIYPPPPGCYQVGLTNHAVARILDNDFHTNQPPRARFLKPEDGQMFSAPTNVRMVVDTADPDGYVGLVEFYANNNKLGEQAKHFLVPPTPGTHIPYEFVWTNSPSGRHVLTARATDNQGLSGQSDPIAIWVVTNPPPPATNLPLVSIVAADPIASEGTNCLRWDGWTNHTSELPPINTARFVVRRMGNTNDPLTVHYRSGGTASNGVDYVQLAGMVTIPAGRRSASILIAPLDDPLPERVETVVLGLRLPPDATNVKPGYYIGFPRRAAAIIVDDDKPRPGTGLLEDHCFHLSLPGTNGAWVRIEASSDAVHWTPLCTLQVTDGAIHFVDAEADELSGRLYRAVPVPDPSLE